MNDLAKKRIERCEDAKQVTPLDCLEYLVDKIKRGELKPTKLSVILCENEGEEMQLITNEMAGVNYMENMGMLMMAINNYAESGWAE